MNWLLESILPKQAYIESRFDPTAKSKAGAVGLAQFMPETWEDFKRHMNDPTLDPTNPKDAVAGQKWYMEWLAKHPVLSDHSKDPFEKSAAVLAAYNWGIGKFQRLKKELESQGVDSTKIVNWINKVPTETKDYVEKLLYNKDKKLEAGFQKAMKTNPIAQLYGKPIPEFWKKSFVVKPPIVNVIKPDISKKEVEEPIKKEEVIQYDYLKDLKKFEARSSFIPDEVRQEEIVEYEVPELHLSVFKKETPRVYGEIKNFQTGGKVTFKGDWPITRRQDFYNQINPGSGFDPLNIIFSLKDINDYNRKNPRPFYATPEEENYFKKYVIPEEKNTVPSANPEAVKNVLGEVPTNSEFSGTYPSMDIALQAIGDTTGVGKIVRNYEEYKKLNPNLLAKKKLQKTYTVGKKILEKPMTWNTVSEYSGVFREPTNLGALRNFSMRWNPNNKQLEMYDIYDFPSLFPSVFFPKRNQPLVITGKVNLDTKAGSKWFRNLKQPK